MSRHTSPSWLVRLLHPLKQDRSMIYCRKLISNSSHQRCLSVCRNRAVLPTTCHKYHSSISQTFKPLAILSTVYIHKRQASNSQKNTKFTLCNDKYRDYLNHLEEEWQDLDKRRNMGEQLGQDKSLRLFTLQKVVDIYEDVKVKYEELETLSQMLNDEEMKEEALLEHQQCLTDIEDLENNLVDIICPVERLDDSDIVLEIESGAGGQEAMLFAEEIFDMYQQFSTYKGWQFNVTDITDSDTGGYRKASATISGQGVYGLLKYEGGVHRVQRVPKTERHGRIHTSTIAVAICPQPSEIDVVLNPKEIQIEVFRSSGPGGQNANVTDSAVRIKHLPTGFTAEIQTTRSQHKNKELALALLRTRIYEKQLSEQMERVTSQRKMQVGNKNRSEKIRTFNFQQDRITDHRLNYNVYDIASFLHGGEKLESLINDLLTEANKENLICLMEEFENSKTKPEKTKARK
ncbi:translation release factor [Mactra antiquata]